MNWRKITCFILLYRHIGSLSEINWFENSLEYQKLIFLKTKLIKYDYTKALYPFIYALHVNIVHKTRVHVWRPASQDFNIFIIIHMFEAHRNERCSWYKFIFGLVFFHRGRRGMVLLRESWFFYTIQKVKALNCFLLCQPKITDLFNLIASTPARIWGGVGGGCQI